MIDGDPGTFWHSRYGRRRRREPHFLVIDTGKMSMVAGLKYTGREDRDNGRVDAYEISLSADGPNWGQPVARGTLPQRRDRADRHLARAGGRALREVRAGQRGERQGLFVRGGAGPRFRRTLPDGGDRHRGAQRGRGMPRQDFKFKTVPGPRPGAALGANFKLVDGEPDDNSAPVDVLHDGKLPDAEDQPEANFFFQNNDDGGRLRVDLGKAIAVKEVNTYSWHTSSRAPQVYKLYGSDGGGAGFVAEPKRPQDPAKGGWTLLATVDTRTRFGDNGGQYGVRVADAAGSLGRFRYLLFDVAHTEDDDAFGNTFFSEIDVVDAGAVADPGPHPASSHPMAAIGKVTVTMDHNEGAEATDAFRFKTVPSPRPSAARAATLSTSGDVDPNSASVEVVHDGRLPDSEDQPDANFFFGSGNQMSRLRFDFGKAIPIKEVDTYSWHSDTRAPQVYRLWGLESTDHPGDWKIIAEVDTRSRFGDAGGQYGVKVAAGDGIIGRYRFLVLDIAPTESDDAFGNTFYSEIDVVDADAAPTAVPQTSTRTSHYDRQGVHLTLTDDSPGFDLREKDRLVDTFFTVYPRMEAEFNHDAPKIVRILLDPNYHGVAQAEGPQIRCNPAWFVSHPEDLDVLTHEGMHVVQHYRQWDPGWITEGIADYARATFGVNNRAADWTMPEYDSKQSYKDAYRVTARFFVWLEKHVKPGVVVTLDQAMREARYTPEFWTRQTGKSVDELWQDYGKNPVL